MDFKRIDITNNHIILNEKKTYTKVCPKRLNKFREGNEPRLVVVRCFFEGPWYGLHNPVERIWVDPPELCSPADLRLFLREQYIALPGLLGNVYLDKFQSFMLIEECEENRIEWDFGETSPREPGILNICLSDLQNARTHANSILLALFSLSIMEALETTVLMGAMFPGFVNRSFPLAFGPYMLFAGGFLLALVGISQDTWYGAVAFLGFGTFWFSNGLEVILETHFSSEGTYAESLLNGPVAKVGAFVHIMFMFAFVCDLWDKPFLSSKLTTILVSLLCVKLIVQAFRLLQEDHDGALAYMQLIFGWATSAFAFWVFLVEVTSEVHKKQFCHTFKWPEEHSPEDVVAVSGMVDTLESNAVRLCQSRFVHDYHRMHASMPQRAEFSQGAVYNRASADEKVEVENRRQPERSTETACS